MNPQLPAVISKISQALAVRPECFITHPSELRLLEALPGDELGALAIEHGWRVVRRVGGRQIEFYNDSGALYRPL